MQWTTIRDGILVVVGSVGLMHSEFVDTCATGSANDKRLIIYAGCLGLAAIFQTSKRK